MENRQTSRVRRTTGKSIHLQPRVTPVLLDFSPIWPCSGFHFCRVVSSVGPEGQVRCVFWAVWEHSLCPGFSQHSCLCDFTSGSLRLQPAVTKRPASKLARTGERHRANVSSHKPDPGSHSHETAVFQERFFSSDKTHEATICEEIDSSFPSGRKLSKLYSRNC